MITSTRDRLALMSFPITWLAVYLPVCLIAYAALRANAFDLSVFDYALWTTHAGPEAGYVPFFGHTLQAQHFMPTLLLLAPLHSLWPSPVFLIVFQVAAVAVAAILFVENTRAQLPRYLTATLVLAFLWSRKSHGAFTSTFYIECLEPTLVFAFVWAATRSRWRVYWPVVVLALGCKEDMAIYVGLYGFLLALNPVTRRQGLLTTALAVVWLVGALTVVIPHARATDGLPPGNPFVESRYGASPLSSAGERLVSVRAAAKLTGLMAATGFLALGGPEVLVVALPGIAMNLAARGEALQSGLVGHYLWPILPWVFLAGAKGAQRLHRVLPRAAVAVAAALAILTVADSPLWMMRSVQQWRDLAVAQRIRDELWKIPESCAVLAQPQLIPHLRHRTQIGAVGREIGSPKMPDVVALSGVGDLWPLSSESLNSYVQSLDADPAYRRVESSFIRFERVTGQAQCRRSEMPIGP